MNLKGAKSLSMSNAVKILFESKGRFMTGFFTKTNGKDRTMQFRYLKGQVVTGTGHVKVREFPSNQIKTLNIQKLKGLKANKETYKLALGVKPRVKKIASI